MIGRKSGIPVSLLLLPAALLLAGAAASASAQTAAESKPALIYPVKDVKVVSAFQNDIYTFMAVHQEGAAKKMWIVAPLCGVQEGDSVTVEEGSLYPQVYNTALDITFENLIVARKLTVNGQEFKAFQAHDMPRGCVAGRPK